MPLPLSSGCESLFGSIVQSLHGRVESFIALVLFLVFILFALSSFLSVVLLYGL